MKVSVTGDVPATPELSPLERAVVAVALAADELSTLRDQVACTEVVSRTYSGVGFVTKFQVPADAPVAAPKAMPPVVMGRHPQLPDAAEFLLELRGGRLHSLEAYCYEGMWPGDETGFSLATKAR